MLARENRIVRGADFRAVVRSGRRSGSSTAVVYVRPGDVGAPTRFGFIVSKGVGNSVHRHLVTRRLRAIAHASLGEVHGVDVIVRALPGSAEASWVTLQQDVRSAMERGVTR